MATFGKTTQGAAMADVTADFQVVSKYTLSENGLVSKLTIFLDGQGTGGAGDQVLKAFIWADVAGAPDALKASSNEVTITDNASGAWVDFSLPVSVQLTAGDYWLGYMAGAVSNGSRYGTDTVTNNRKYKARAYASGPLDPFGAPDATDNTQIDIYATYSTIVTSPPPHRIGRGSAW